MMYLLAEVIKTTLKAGKSVTRGNTLREVALMFNEMEEENDANSIGT